MNSKPILLLTVMLFTYNLFSQNNTIGKLPPFTKWYENPLGISPINLHTANGLLLPAIAATAILLLSDSDNTNKLNLYSNIGFSKGYYGSKTNVLQHELGFMYEVRKYLSLGAEIITYHPYDIVNDTWGFGIRPNVRFNIINKSNLKLYGQSGAGLIYFIEEFPQPSGFFGDNRKGTHLNGSPKYGIGSDVSVSKNLKLSIGIWHIHVSNGNTYGESRNPGHDSNGFSLGLSKSFN